MILILLLAALSLPISVHAFWPWDQPAASPAVPVAANLSQADKDAVAARYKIWSDSFEKNNVAAVIAHQNDFWFTVPELNYLFAQETSQQNNPILTDFSLSLTGTPGVFSIAADFKDIFIGHFSFSAQVVNYNNKAHLNLSSVRLYGWPIPAAWLNAPLDKVIDNYFAFLYADSRYTGFAFSADNGVLKFQPEFK